jgi:hypothetical protein
MTVDAVAGRAQLSGTAISESDWITIDGVQAASISADWKRL